MCKTLLLKMSCIRTRTKNNSQTNALALNLAMKQRFETEAWSNNSENRLLNSLPPPPPSPFLHHIFLFPFAYLAHSTLSTLCLLSISKMVTTHKKCWGLTHAKNAPAYQSTQTRSSEHAVLLSDRVGAHSTAHFFSQDVAVVLLLLWPRLFKRRKALSPG